MEAGGKLKELRVLEGPTQEELADQAELFKGFISQLKRDLTSPSTATLMDILQCLGIIIGDFFTEAPDEQIVFNKQGYSEKTDANSNNEVKWIIPSAQKDVMKPILPTLKVGGSAHLGNPHKGEEFEYVLQGVVSIHPGTKAYKAKKGESFYFVPDKKHYLTSKSGALLLWTGSLPSLQKLHITIKEERIYHELAIR